MKCLWVGASSGCGTRRGGESGFFKGAMLILLFGITSTVLKLQQTYSEVVANHPVEGAKRQQTNLLSQIGEHVSQVYPAWALGPEFACLRLGNCVSVAYTPMRLQIGSLLAGRTVGTTGALSVGGEVMYDTDGERCVFSLERTVGTSPCLFSALSEYRIICPSSGLCNEKTATVSVRITLQKHPFYVARVNDPYRLLPSLSNDFVVSSESGQEVLANAVCPNPGEVLVAFEPGKISCVALPTGGSSVKPSQYCGNQQFISGIQSTGDIVCGNL